jgi:hypothetical protein
MEVNQIIIAEAPRWGAVLEGRQGACERAAILEDPRLKERVGEVALSRLNDSTSGYLICDRLSIHDVRKYEMKTKDYMVVIEGIPLVFVNAIRERFPSRMCGLAPFTLEFFSKPPCP